MRQGAPAHHGAAAGQGRCSATALNPQDPTPQPPPSQPPTLQQVGGNGSGAGPNRRAASRVSHSVGTFQALISRNLDCYVHPGLASRATCSSPWGGSAPAPFTLIFCCPVWVREFKNPERTGSQLLKSSAHGQAWPVRGCRPEARSGPLHRGGGVRNLALPAAPWSRGHRS